MTDASLQSQEALKRKLPLSAKVGYSVGGITDTVCYDVVSGFLLFFMTDMAGVSPIFAGAIVAIGAFWDACDDPIIGALADRTRTRFGKKRTWLLIAIPVILAGYLPLFTVPESLTGGALNAYFLIFTLIFWTGYTCFETPYYSMGGALTMDNDERSQIRMFAQWMQSIGCIISVVIPTPMVELFMTKGCTEYEAWHWTGFIECGIAILTLLIVFLTTRGLELDIENESVDEEEKTNFFKDCIQVLRIKPYLIITLSSLFYRIGYCMAATTCLYFLLYCCRLQYAQAALYSAPATFGGIIFVAIMMKIIEKMDKAWLYVIVLLFAGIVLFLFTFLHTWSLGLVVVLGLLYSLCGSAYWSLNYPIMYDCFEVDEFQSGKRREGTCTALYSFMQKLGYALSSIIIGAVLTAVGYDESLGANNPQNVLDTIQFMYCGVTGLCTIISAVIVIFFPLKKDTYSKLYAELEKQRVGLPYSTEGLEKILNKKFYEEHL